MDCDINYICDNCGKLFSKPLKVITTYEEYLGIASDFMGKNEFIYYCCPICNSMHQCATVCDSEYFEDIINE